MMKHASISKHADVTYDIKTEPDMRGNMCKVKTKKEPKELSNNCQE